MLNEFWLALQRDLPELVVQFLAGLFAQLGLHNQAILVAWLDP